MGDGVFATSTGDALVFRVEPFRESSELEFGADDAFILAKLRSIADRLAAKVREDGKSFRTVTVKLRYNDMQDVSRALSLDEPSDLEQDIYPVLPRLLKKAWEQLGSPPMIVGGDFADGIETAATDNLRAKMS